MSGVEALIGGAFVSVVIKTVVATAKSYFSDKYMLHKGTKEMLESLETSLPRVLWVLEFAERKPIVQNASLAAWLQQLKDVAYEAEDVMDDFEAKRIRDSLKIKGKVSKIATSSARAVRSFFLSDSDERNLKDLIGKIKKICDGIGDLTKYIESGNKSASDGLTNSPTGPTSSYLSKTKKIFGRAKEIELILDMIMTEKQDQNVTVDKNDAQDQSETVEKNDAPQRSILTHNFLKNFCNFVANSLKGFKENIAEKGEEKAESSDPFGVIQENVNPTGHKFSSKEPEIYDSTPHSYNEFSISIGDPSIRVLPIVGIGGIGKTTIAQVIYNHSKVTEYFDLQGWVYVTENLDPQKFFYDILCSFDAGTSKFTTPITSLGDGHITLKSVIEHKRFLLVFDDVREGINPTWIKMIEVLADGEWGSMVIVTTDSNSVATEIGTFPPIFLDYLPSKQFLDLFEYYAFGHNMKKCNNEPTCKKGNHYFPLTQHQETVLKPIGEKIAEKLHGLPLAAEVIGTLLSRKTEREYWERILESDWWVYEVSKQIITPLVVGFQNLDPDLNQCFIYCSLFPRNYVFDKDRLVQMWIAHDFIHPTVEEKMKVDSEEIKIEDIGRSKFDKLVDRFFFQNTVVKNKYVMHHLIREFAIAISSEMLYISGNDNKQIPSCVRHVAIDNPNFDNAFVDYVKWSEKNIKNLRTMMFFGFCKMGNNKSLEELKRLRLLDLSYLTSQISLPDKCKLSSHLRFLDLSFSQIREIPKSLCDLVHLQVLDMRGCYFSTLPDGMNRLINLQHLYARPHMISLIRGIGRLTNLQDLEEFFVRPEEGFTISELADLKVLTGQLTLRNLEKIPSKEQAISAKLEEKRYLTSLIFNVSGYIYRKPKHHQQEILEGLKPHKNIRELSIKIFLGVSFPSWVMEIHEMNNLTSIQLEQCEYIVTLPPLGSLPSLEVLNLSGLESITCIGKEFYGTSDVTFPSLRELTFEYMGNWEIWSDPGERKCFPCLQKLKIEFCLRLSETPLHCLNSMVELHLLQCDMVTKNVGIYFLAMTSLTLLYLGGTLGLKPQISYDHLRELRVLVLQSLGISQLEGQISSLVNLKKLKFLDCCRESTDTDRQLLLGGGGLQTQNMHSLPSLACIEVLRCKRIPEVLFSVGRFPSLRTLRISSFYRGEFTLFEDSWLQQLSSLEDLELCNCEYLRCLPPSLSTLSSLKKFTLKDCPKIRSLPQEGLPQSLMELYIIKCSPELSLGCEPNMGAEWSKISHVPCIRVKRNDHTYLSSRREEIRGRILQSYFEYSLTHDA